MHIDFKMIDLSFESIFTEANALESGFYHPEGQFIVLLFTTDPDEEKFSL